MLEINDLAGQQRVAVDSVKLENGKITPEERKRRLDEGLCMYCGVKGHMAKDCLKLAKANKRSEGIQGDLRLCRAILG